jgi:hypothetical protein
MRPHEVAAKYIGQTEKPGNSGFNDAEFEKRMRAAGFQTGQAWCAYFCELVFKETYPTKFAELDKLFSGSTIQTFRNFRDAAYLIGNVPQVDALVIWQSYKAGKPQATGHAGIVSKMVSTWEFESIEGNTSDAKSREGYIVARHQRKVLADVKDGLKVLGFITISPPITITI